MRTWIQNYLNSQKTALDSIDPAAIEVVVEILREAHQADRRVFVIGNGGSAANASHFATDLGKGASDKLSKRFRVMSLTDNTPWITALGNDDSYDDVFRRQLENYAEPGDVVICMSVSGNSPNLVAAVTWANDHGLQTVGLISAHGGRLEALAKTIIKIDDTHFGRVEDCHMGICHLLAYAFMELPELQ
jgi:D-sedoheptulose 7-phosphate isomerase